jgi:hypothetical protein
VEAAVYHNDVEQDNLVIQPVVKVEKATTTSSKVVVRKRRLSKNTYLLNHEKDLQYQKLLKEASKVALRSGAKRDEKGSTSSFSMDHFERVGSSFAREYNYSKSISDVCVYTHNGRNRGQNVSHAYIYNSYPRGLFYVKVPKAASSTLAGINFRIALRHGQIHDNEEEEATPCTHHENHIDGVGRYYGNRDTSKSFLWASVRDPASRALSRIFSYFISELQKEPSDANIKSLLNGKTVQTGSISNGEGGYQLRYMALKEIPGGSFWNEKSPGKVLKKQELEERVRELIREYDFVAVTERMDESLVALQLLLDLDLGDILITSAKVSDGSYSMAHLGSSKEEAPCFKMKKGFLSQEIQDYFHSDQWYAQNYGDYLLYHAANKSLDLTIDKLGRDQFQKALDKYRRAKKLVDDECSSKAVFPCSNNGTNKYHSSKEDCYSFDEGCGYPCVDALLSREKWIEQPRTGVED